MSSISSGTTSTTTLVHSGDTTGSLVFKTNDTGSGGTTAMTIDTSQNVGIGTSSPTDTGAYGRALDVQGNGGSAVYVRSTTTPSSNYGYIGFTGGASNLDIWNNPAGNIRFYNNGSERMRIDSSGNLLVGTTSPGSGNSGRVLARQTSSGGYAVVADAVSNGGTYYLIGFQINGTTVVGQITSNGSTTTYATSSDYRLKENIAPMTGALAKVAQLKPVTYKWKETGATDEGFIAHELAEVCPSAVVGAKDAVDENGNPVYQGIDTSFLVATLTAAIQEQQATITALTARIEALEKK